MHYEGKMYKRLAAFPFIVYFLIVGDFATGKRFTLHYIGVRLLFLEENAHSTLLSSFTSSRFAYVSFLLFPISYLLASHSSLLS